MERAAILKETFVVETKLLEVSKKIKHAQAFDSIESWIRHLLKEDTELAKHFVIPTEARVKKALIDLVTIESPLSKPILNLLSTRIASYVVVIDDLRVHPIIGPAVKDILENFKPLLDLVHKYDFHFEQKKNIELTRQALEHNRLHIYQSYSKEPLIRIVLKTLQLDQSRADEQSLQYLLDFLFDQLKKNLLQPGFISQPRHAWWAFLDLLEESNGEWLRENRRDLNKILLSFLRAVEYFPKESDPASVVPEMNSRYNEDVWVTLNMMRVYRTSIHELLPSATINNLVARIELNMRRISEGNDDSIRSNQCKLLVLYEALAYLNYVDTLKLRSEKQIDLRERFIGNYLYNDELLGNYREIKTTIRTLISNRQNWTKHMLSSLLISGPPASGKSELMKQIVAEIWQIATENGKQFKQQFLTIGTELNSAEDLHSVMQGIKTSWRVPDGVLVVAFDEFDKARFDFLAPFLKPLAAETEKDEPVTFWLFGQSSYATYHNIKSHADSLQDKTLRDFLTRFELGKLDLSELKVSPQQRVLTALGYAINKYQGLESVSRSCVLHFATNEKLRTNRQLIADFEKTVIFEKNRLSVAENLSTIRGAENQWVKIVR